MRLITLVVIFSVTFGLSGCAALKKMEEERQEKLRQELIQFRSINNGLVGFYEKEMLPLLEAKGSLEPESSTFDAEAEFSLEEKYVEIKWSNNVSLLLTGKIYQKKFDSSKFKKARRSLLKKYKNHIENSKGTVLKKDIGDYGDEILTGHIEGDCKLDQIYLGYIQHEIDSAFLTFSCRTPTIYHPSLFNTYQGVRILDGSMVDD